METNIEQLRCGDCGEYAHNLYKRDSGELISECLKCESQSEIKITQPKIVIRNIAGDGTLCVY